MNIAIMFGGRITGYQSCIENLNNIKKTYNPTFFCSLNESFITENINQFFNEFDIKQGQYNIEPTIIPNSIYSLEKYPETKYLNSYSMIFHKKRCFDLIKNFNKKFDIVLQYRVDIDSSELISFITPIPKTVYIPNCNDWRGGINDQISYGDFNSMEKYCKLLDNIFLFCKQKSKFNLTKKILFHPEILLRKQLEYSNVNIVRFDYNYMLSSARFNHS